MISSTTTLAKREKSVTISLRVSETALKALQDDAKKHNVSINTLANQVLLTYAEFDRFLKRFGMIKLPLPMLNRVLGAAADEAIIEAGEAVGASVPESFILAKTGELSVANTLEHLRQMGTYANLFEYSEVTHGGKITITLSHELGPKGSLFLASYISSISKSLGMQIKPAQFNDSISFECDCV